VPRCVTFSLLFSLLYYSTLYYSTPESGEAGGTEPVKTEAGTGLATRKIAKESISNEAREPILLREVHGAGETTP